MTRIPSEPPRLLHDGEFLRLVRHGHWEYVQRRAANGAAAIIAVTDARELILVEQYRIPVAANTIELPAGVIGDDPAFASESVEASARRELLEETGLSVIVADDPLSCVARGAGIALENMDQSIGIFASD